MSSDVRRFSPVLGTATSSPSSATVAIFKRNSGVVGPSNKNNYFMSLSISIRVSGIWQKTKLSIVISKYPTFSSMMECSRLLISVSHK
jgi:hypothetical protein